MLITWCGHSCFKIQDKIGEKNIILTTDPFDKKIGLKQPCFDTDIITISHDHYDHNNVQSLKGNPFIIKTAGEYDIKGVMIKGVESFHDTKNGIERGDNIIYKIEMNNIIITHLGDLGHILDNKQLAEIANTDILLIPVGGKYTLDAKMAVEVISQIEPRIIIPMHYKIDGLNLNIDSADKFVKEIGLKPVMEEKLKINKRDLPQEDMELVILNL